MQQKHSLGPSLNPYNQPQVPYRLGAHLKLGISLTTGVCSVVAFAAIGAATAQTLKITSPPSGTLVHPGDTLSVTIESPDAKVEMVSLIGESPFDFFTPPSETPTRVEVKVPRDACCRKFQFTAVGVLQPGKPIDSEPITIDVEPSNPPTKLLLLNAPPIFRSPDGPVPIVSEAVFSDGTRGDMTYSSRITYSSVQPDIASVDRQGEVTPRMPGKTSVLITYAQDSHRVQLTVPVTVNVGPLAASAYSVKFSELPVGMQSIEETITLTARTLGPIRIVELKVKGDYSETDNCTSSPIPHGDTCDIRVKFAPRAKGERNGEIDLLNDFSGSGLVISLEGIGR